MPLVRDLFLAARSVEPAIADPRAVALELVPAHDGAKPIEELCALLDRAEAERGWLVLLFHGVGGDHMSVPLETHLALLEQLAARRQTLWTERFGVVAAHIARERAAATSAVPAAAAMP